MRRDQKGLIVVVRPALRHLEAGEAEEARERAEAEVRAVLVVHVPEGALPEHPVHIGKLEEDCRIRPIAERPPDHLHELLRLVDVLEGVPAVDEVRREMRILLGVEIANEGDAARGLALETVLVAARVDADAALRSKLAEELEELPLPAADLEDVAVGEVVALDHQASEALGEAIETRREMLRLLIALRVLVEPHVEREVRDERARRAKA